MRLPRVLIAEDIHEQRELLRMALRDAPFRVEFAEDGEVAVKMATDACAAEDGYNLILLDGAMPNLSGLGAAERLLQADPKCDATIYFLTNLPTDDATLNLRVRLMNLDPQIHIIPKQDNVTRMPQLIEELLARPDAEARGASGN